MNWELSELVPMSDLCGQQLINHLSFGNLRFWGKYEFGLNLMFGLSYQFVKKDNSIHILFFLSWDVENLVTDKTDMIFIECLESRPHL